MRPSSSHSDAPYAGLLGELPGDPVLDALIDDAALLAAMLRFEAALASGQGAVGLIPQDSGRVIEAKAKAAAYDVDELGRAAAASGNPVVPLVSWLAGDVNAADSTASAHVHFGATSQDVLDTALMMTAHAAVGRILERIGAAADRVASLAGEHAQTLMTGRTLGQSAAPITFGLKAIGWLDGLDAASARLTGSRARLAIQLGGPVGTQAAYGDKAGALADALAAQLGLAVAPPWHAERSRVVELGAALGQTVVACAKIATDVVLLSQNEIGEVSEYLEAGRGRSSSMPHKHNPIGSVLVRSAAVQAPGLVATILAAATHDGERATGSWHAEWAPLRQLLHLAGGAVDAIADVVSGLRVNEAVMREHIEGVGAAMFAEPVARALSPHLGPGEAQVVAAAAARAAVAEARPYAAVLADDARVSAALSPAQLRQALDPSGHVAAAARLVHNRLAGRA